jgi:hypothetical protein
VLTPGTDGVRCCDEVAVTAMLDALRAGNPGPIELPVVTVPPATSTADLDALGIREEVSSFSTPHACCVPRVQNIHLAAEKLRGIVIKPGEMFSLNAALGERTEDNGYVSAPTIKDGVLVDDFGGGVSQVATTLFNAAYFAGLKYGEYQSHSFYISRYPFGREATVSWPAPDLEINNVSPYGILIWPTYTDREITITFYSTKWVASVESSDPITYIVGQSCTRVETTRTVTFLDGSTSSGIVGARYRAMIDDETGLPCESPLTEDATLTTAPGQPPPTLPNGATTTLAPPVNTSSTTTTEPPPTSSSTTTTSTAPTTTAATTTAPPATDPPPTEPSGPPSS